MTTPPRPVQSRGLSNAVNPTGSPKDRASAVVLARAAEIGAERVAVASTGNAGSSLAGLAASLGIPAAIFVPATAPRAKLIQAPMMLEKAVVLGV